jgi:hypothetical protein
VAYTAHELRHVCASLLIASGASDMQAAHQMGTARSRQPRTFTDTCSLRTGQTCSKRRMRRSADCTPTRTPRPGEGGEGRGRLIRGDKGRPPGDWASGGSAARGAETGQRPVHSASQTRAGPYKL